MFQQQMSRYVHDDRTREMRARFVDAQRREAARARRIAIGRPSRSIRRSIGRSIVRVGQAIAADSGQPVASS